MLLAYLLYYIIYPLQLMIRYAIYSMFAICVLIIVPEIPKIIEHPSSITLPEGNKTVEAIKCLATGEKDLHYEWEKYHSYSDGWRYGSVIIVELLGGEFPPPQKFPDPS